jgi:hypothetical protein
LKILIKLLQAGKLMDFEVIIKVGSIALNSDIFGKYGLTKTTGIKD